MRGGYSGLGIAGAVSAASVSTPTRKIYGAENIKRHLQRQKRNYGHAPGSLAGYAHKDERAVARRLRQSARDMERQEHRLVARGGSAPGVYAEGVVIGISRRGRFVVV